MKVQNQEIRNHISNIVSTALDYNSTHSYKRFFPMMSSRYGKLNEYGIYDYQTKKYTLFSTRARSLTDDLAEMEKFVNEAVKIAPNFKK